MKKTFLCLAISLISYAQGMTQQKACSYVIKVRPARGIKLREPLFGVYKGKPLELSAHCEVIAECSKTAAFSIIITSDVTHEAEGNNVRYLRRKELLPFAWYDLTLRVPTLEDDEKTARWDIKKLNPADAPLQLPEHAIVVYFNPEYIEKLENSTTPECKNIPASQVIALPTIVLRSDIDEEELNQAAEEAQLASLELRTLHRKPMVTTKCDQRAIMTLCKNL